MGGILTVVCERLETSAGLEPALECSGTVFDNV